MLESSPKFTFCLLADTHVNSGASGVAEDYLKPVNRRVEWVVADIQRRRPKFVIHMGDIIQPVPGASDRSHVTSIAKEIMRELPSPVHYIPGNHDIGDKPASWIRAPKVNEGSIAQFEEDWGPSFQSFDYEDCHFVLLNSSVMNGPYSTNTRQRSWLSRDLDLHRGKRIFLFSHYMLYLNEPCENENYEAIDEPWRADILQVIRRYPVEAVFSAHTHNLFVDRYHGVDLYTLPSTSFYRAEFNSLFTAEPVMDDLHKLGYFEVAVYADRHASRLVRLPEAYEVYRSGPSVITGGIRESSLAPVGIYADVPPVECVRLPASIGTKEFSRKTVRNDHLHWVLTELPVGALKVPVGDLSDQRVRPRLEQLAADGCRIYAFGFPRDCEKAIENAEGAGLISGLEILSPHRELRSVMDEVHAWSVRADLPIFMAPISSWVDNPDSQRGRRPVTVGVSLRDPGAEEMIEFIAREGFGVSLYLGSKEDPLVGFVEVGMTAEESSVRWIATVSVRSGSEREVCNRVAAVLVSAFTRREAGVFIEGLTDWVWGRNKISGIVDNRYNPRRAYFVYRNLHHILEEFGPSEVEKRRSELDGVEAIILRNSVGEERTLLLPWKSQAIVPTGRQWLDLKSGEALCSGHLRGPALEAGQ